MTRTRLVFIGTATHDPGRVQRPTTSSEWFRLGKSGVTDIHLVDPEYASTMITLDTDLRGVDRVRVFPELARSYFWKHPVRPIERVVIIDCTGAATRYDLVNRYGVLPSVIDNVVYIPLGCHGKYAFETDFHRYKNGPYNALVSQGCTAKYIKGRDVIAYDEQRAFCQDLFALVAYIKGRYYTEPRAVWTTFGDALVPPERLAEVVGNIYRWYNNNFQADLMDRPVPKKLDMIREVVQRWLAS